MSKSKIATEIRSAVPLDQSLDLPLDPGQGVPTSFTQAKRDALRVTGLAL